MSARPLGGHSLFLCYNAYDKYICLSGDGHARKGKRAIVTGSFFVEEKAEEKIWNFMEMYSIV